MDATSLREGGNEFEGGMQRVAFPRFCSRDIFKPRRAVELLDVVLCGRPVGNCGDVGGVVCYAE